VYRTYIAVLDIWCFHIHISTCEHIRYQSDFTEGNSSNTCFSWK